MKKDKHMKNARGLEEGENTKYDENIIFLKGIKCSINLMSNISRTGVYMLFFIGVYVCSFS